MALGLGLQMPSINSLSSCWLMFSHSSIFDYSKKSHMIDIILQFKNENLHCSKTSAIKLLNVTYCKCMTFYTSEVIKV